MANAEFTDDELQVLETALRGYVSDLARDAQREPDEDTKDILYAWAFVAQDVMLKLHIDPAEPTYELPDSNS